MPRTARIKSNINIYHIVIRGADRQLLFEETSDYLKYLELLDYYKAECHFDIYAYCLMSNHVHLLIHTNDTSIETIFRKLNTCYAVWFNMKYDRTGALQEGRYHSEPIENEQYLFNAIRYIHLNPLKAGLEDAIGSSYKWNSYNDFLTNNSKLINTPIILTLMGGVDQFCEFHQLSNNDNFKDIDTARKRLPDDVAKQIIVNECNCNTSTDFQKLSLRERNNQLLLLHQKGLSIRQLNRLTGIPKGVIDRIVTKGHSL